MPFVDPNPTQEYDLRYRRSRDLRHEGEPWPLTGPVKLSKGVRARLTKEQTDKAVLLTGGILAGGALVILGGFAWKALRKSDELPSAGTGAGIRAGVVAPTGSGFVPPVGFATHSVTVVAGDSPWAIAQRHNVAGRPRWWQELKNANPGKPVNAKGFWTRLVPGESVNIPLEWTSGPAVTVGMWSPGAPGEDEGPVAA